MRIDVERTSFKKGDKVKLTVVADNLSDSGPGRLAEALRAGGQDELADKWAKQINRFAQPPKPKKGKKAKKVKAATLELTDPFEIRSFADCIRNVWPTPTREINDALAGIA